MRMQQDMLQQQQQQQMLQSQHQQHNQQQIVSSQSMMHTHQYQQYPPNPVHHSTYYHYQQYPPPIYQHQPPFVQPQQSMHYLMQQQVINQYNGNQQGGVYPYQQQQVVNQYNNNGHQRGMQQDVSQLNVGFWSSQDGAQPQDVANHEQQIHRGHEKARILFICLAARDWKRIEMQYGHFMFVRSDADAVLYDLEEGIDIVRSQFIYGGDNSDIIPEYYDGLFISYVLNTELGRHHLQCNSHILGTDELEQRQKAQATITQLKLQHKAQNAKKEMENARLVLKLAERRVEEQRQLYQQQLTVQTELDQEKQQFDNEKESGLSLSMEVDHGDEIVNQVNELLMGLSLQGGTPVEQEEHNMKVIRQMYSIVMNGRIDRISVSIKNERKKGEAILDAKAKAEEETLDWFVVMYC